MFSCKISLIPAPLCEYQNEHGTHVIFYVRDKKRFGVKRRYFNMGVGTQHYWNCLQSESSPRLTMHEILYHLGSMDIGISPWNCIFSCEDYKYFRGNMFPIWKFIVKIKSTFRIFPDKYLNVLWKGYRKIRFRKYLHCWITQN